MAGDEISRHLRNPAWVLPRGNKRTKKSPGETGADTPLRREDPGVQDTRHFQRNSDSMWYQLREVSKNGAYAPFWHTVQLTRTDH
jgi:hypothetical protein